jgi:hypothetical protein
MSKIESLEDKAWYQNPMVWMVIFFPAVAVVAGISTIFIAINSDDGLVVDDYYKQGLQINQVIDHDRRASELGLSALLDANSQTGKIHLKLSSTSDFTPPPELTFKLLHRTIAGYDQVTTLTNIGDAEYQGYVKPPIVEGRWTLQVLSDKTWRLRQNFTTRKADNILINISAR